MQDIFLSYSTKDRDRLAQLVDVLEAQGWSVFWDHRSIKVSQDWHDVVGEAIQHCACVIVVWSEASVKSRWVKEEALIARDRGVLYPVLLDRVNPPFGFNMIQAADFTSWDGKVTHPEFVELREQLASCLSLNNTDPDADTTTPVVEAVAVADTQRKPVSGGCTLQSLLIVIAGLILIVAVSRFFTQS